jgi:hypothetical protein
MITIIINPNKKRRATINVVSIAKVEEWMLGACFDGLIVN